MGIVHIELDQPDYTQIDAAMERMGFALTIPAVVDGTERLFRLPRGSYWRAEDLGATQLLEDAMSALHAADELGARVLASAGETAWMGLEMVEPTPA